MVDADDDGQAAPPGPAASPQVSTADAPAPGPAPADNAASEPSQSAADTPAPADVPAPAPDPAPVDSVPPEPNACVEPAESNPATTSPEDAGSESSAAPPSQGGTDGPTTSSGSTPADGSAQPNLTDEHYDWIHQMCGKDARGDRQAADGGSTPADASGPGGMTGAAPGTAPNASDMPKSPEQQADQPKDDSAAVQNDSGAAHGNEDQMPAPDQQTTGQHQTQTPDPDQSNDPNAGQPDLLLDPNAGKGTTGGFTKTPEQVEKEVTGKFGKYIPKGQLDSPASKVTNFQDNTTFQNELNNRHPDLAKFGIDPNSVVGESYEGKIYINKDKADIGTAYHEQMHHYSNPDFIKRFGMVSGVKFNEGVTEYLTRQTYSGSRSGHYDTEEKLAKVIAKKVGEDTLRKAYFQGDETAMKKIDDAFATK